MKAWPLYAGTAHLAFFTVCTWQAESFAAARPYAAAAMLLGWIAIAVNTKDNKELTNDN